MFRFASLLCIASATALTWPATAADSSASIPDLSGPWAREFIGFEQPASGHGPTADKPDF